MHATAWDEDREFDALVVGDLNIDLIMSGLARIPRFGEEMLASGIARCMGGSAANCAVCCARLGMNVALVARVGRDEFGDFLVQQVRKWGVADDFITRDPELTTGVTVALSGARDRAFVTYVGTIDSLRGEDVPRELLARSRHMHVASYFLQTKLQPGLPDLVEDAHTAGLSVSLDTGYDPAEEWDAGLLELMPDIDIFLPNETEAQQITGTDSIEASFAALSALTDVLAVKLGADGALGAAGGETVDVPAFSVITADTTCCGDAFNAGFIDAIMAGGSLEQSLVRGNACGGLMASVMGNDAHALSRDAVEHVVGGGEILTTEREGR